MAVVLRQLDSGRLSSEGSLWLLELVHMDQGSLCQLDLVQENQGFLGLLDLIHENQGPLSTRYNPGRSRKYN